MLLYLINGMKISKFLNVEEGKEKKKVIHVVILSFFYLKIPRAFTSPVNLINHNQLFYYT